MSELTLRVCALYPDLMNIYADRGNLLLLERRCAWRGIGFTVTAAGLGAEVDPDAHDLFYLGGGQDRDQRRCAADLQQHRAGLAEAAATGAVVLGVCGGYQLLGHSYRYGDEVVEGVGLLDVVTHAPDAGTASRLVGPVVADVVAPHLAGGDRVRLAGFENHRGRTTLGPGAAPLARVVAGHGNDGADGTEGAVSGRVIGTYLHGPLLAKNAWFADRLISLATSQELAPVADRFEEAVHRDAIARGVDPR